MVASLWTEKPGTRPVTIFEMFRLRNARQRPGLNLREPRCLDRPPDAMSMLEFRPHLVGVLAPDIGQEIPTRQHGAALLSATFHILPFLSVRWAANRPARRSISRSSHDRVGVLPVGDFFCSARHARELN